MATPKKKTTRRQRELDAERHQERLRNRADGLVLQAQLATFVGGGIYERVPEASASSLLAADVLVLLLAVPLSWLLLVAFHRVPRRCGGRLVRRVEAFCLYSLVGHTFAVALSRGLPLANIGL